MTVLRPWLALIAITALCACKYAKRDLCTDDACVAAADKPPVAIIADVGDDGALLVGAGSDVIVDGSQSSDPDGDVLGFSWSVDASCRAVVVGDTTSPTLRLSGLMPSTTCTVILTVDDGRGGTAMATATLIINDVGGFVTQDASNCLSAFDPASTAPQGTPATPFCSLTLGLDAAQAYHLAEVSLDQGTHGATGVVTVDFNTTVRGGYTRGATAWTHADGAVSDLALQQTPIGADESDAALVITSGAAVTIQDLAVYRVGACVADCNTIVANEASLTLDDVIVDANGTGAQPLGTSDASSRSAFSVYVSGPTDGGVQYALTATNLTTYSPARAAATVGVFVQGNVRVRLDTLAVHGSNAPTVVGVRTLALPSLVMNDPTIVLTGDGSSSSVAYGIVDGTRDSIAPFAATCASAAVCGGSVQITINGGTLEAATATSSAGLVALGTSQLDVSGTNLSAIGNRAWGVLLSGVGSGDRGHALFSGITAGATPAAIDGPAVFAVGFGDNYVGSSNDPTLGSKNLTIENAAIQSKLLVDSVPDLASIYLVATSNAQITNSTLQVNGSVSTAADQAAGLHSVGVSGLSVSATSSGTPQALNFATAFAGFWDGGLPGDTFPESQGVTLQNVAVTGLVRGESGAQAADVIAVKTHQLVVEGDYQGGTNLALEGDTVAFLLGVLLAEADNPIVRGNTITLSSSDPTATLTQSVTHSCIHDGALDANDVSHGSSSVVISGNRLTTQQVSVQARGVTLRGSDGFLVDDNVVINAGSAYGIGVFAQSSGGIVAFNTIRNAGCGSCGDDDTYAVGVYEMHPPGGNGVSVFANIFDTTAATTYLERPAIVWQDGGSLTSMAFGPTADNIWGDEADNSVAGKCVTTINDTGTAMIVPFTGGAFDAGEIGVNNSASVGKFCSDGVHSDPTGPQHAAAIDVDQTYGHDIDGESRATPFDIGADAITGSCQ